MILLAKPPASKREEPAVRAVCVNGLTVAGARFTGTDGYCAASRGTVRCALKTGQPGTCVTAAAISRSPARGGWRPGSAGRHRAAPAAPGSHR